jgi:hypothetical protein
MPINVESITLQIKSVETMFLIHLLVERLLSSTPDVLDNLVDALTLEVNNLANDVSARLKAETLTIIARAIIRIQKET